MAEQKMIYEEVLLTNTNNLEEEMTMQNSNCGCTANPGEIADIDTYPHGVTCSRVHTQAADVSLPVCIKPYAKMGTIETRCCGEPVVTIQNCSTSESKGCGLIITQTICAKIPVEYGVTSTTGEVTISCRRAAPIE